MNKQQERLKINQAHNVNQASRITKNSFFLLVANVSDVVFALVSVAILARYLGVEVYGQYVFIISIILVFDTISQFGMRRIIIREVSKDKENVGKYMGSFIIIRCILSAIAFGAVAVTINILNLSEIYKTATYILMASQTISTFSMAFMTIFYAFEKMAYQTIISAVNNVLGIIFIIFVVSLDLGFIPLMIAMILPNVATFFLSYILLTKKISRPKFEFNPKQWKLLIKESYPLFIEMVFRQNFLRVDIFIIKALRSASEVALFNAPYSLILRLQMIPLAFTTSLFPLMSRHADTSREAFKSTYVKAFKILFNLSLPFAIATTILADKIIIIIFGINFIKSAVALKILIWMVTLMFLDSIINTVLVSLKKQWFSAVSHAAMFIVNLILDLLLVPIYGYVGACIGNLFAYMTRFILSYYFISKNDITLPLDQILPKPLLSGAAMGVIMYFFRELNIVATLSLGFIAYAGSAILLGTFSKDELGFFKKALNLRT